MNTQGMTPEEKAAVMQFMGQTYGQLHQQDQIWEKICKDLKWQYIPSI